MGENLILKHNPFQTVEATLREKLISRTQNNGWGWGYNTVISNFIH